MALHSRKRFPKHYSRKEGARHHWTFVARRVDRELGSAITVVTELECFRCGSRCERWDLHRRYLALGGNWRSKCPPCELRPGTP